MVIPCRAIKGDAAQPSWWMEVNFISLIFSHVIWEFSAFLGGDMFQACGGTEVHSGNYKKL
jgi:hypothetical protein